MQAQYSTASKVQSARPIDYFQGQQGHIASTEALVKAKHAFPIQKRLSEGGSILAKRKQSADVHFNKHVNISVEPIWAHVDKPFQSNSITNTSLKNQRNLEWLEQQKVKKQKLDDDIRDR